jgi:PAS domain-containing protein
LPKVSQVVRNPLILRKADGRAHARADSRSGITPSETTTCEPSFGNALGLREDWLFLAAAEPVLIISAATESILEANPAAATLLGIPRSALVGTVFHTAFAASSAAAVKDSLAVARGAGAASPLCIRARNGTTELIALLSFVRAAHKSYVLVRLSSQATASVCTTRGRTASPVFDAIEGAAAGFVMTDCDLRVDYANHAFVRMVELASLDDARGKSLTCWLALSQVDVAQLHRQMHEREAVTILKTRLNSDKDTWRDVDVRAVAVPDRQNACWGFSICERPRLN